MKNCIYLFLLSLLFIIPVCIYSHPQKIDPAVFPILDNLCQGVIDNKNTPGVALLIGNCEDEDDMIIYQKAYGKRNESESLTIDTLYDLASVTKCTFTTMAIMLLINDGVISDDDLVTKYIPDFGQQNKGDVKIKHLLTHTSGLPAYTSTTDLPAGPNPDALINKICSLAKIYTTGSGYTYSCLNFITLARIAENASEECMHNFLKRRLWDEIGMIDTTSFPTAEQIKRTAPTVSAASRRGVVHDPLAYYYTDYNAKNHACGNAGGFSTIQDISRLARLILHEGKLYNKQIISKDNMKKITTQQTNAAARTYGWAVMSGSSYTNPQNNTPETCCIAHSGYTGTYVYLDKYSKTYIIIFTNCVYPSDSETNRSAIGTLRQQIIRKVLDHLDIYNAVSADAFVADNDNGEPIYSESGAWITVTSSGYASKTFRYSTAGSDSAAKYKLNFSVPGKYMISAWYKSSTDRCTSAQYIVNHKSGISNIILNQQLNNSQWTSLGIFDFNTGEYDLIIDAKNSSGGSYIVADSIRADCIVNNSEIVIDNSDSGYSDTSNFFSSSSSPLRYGADYRACNPITGDSAKWEFSIPEKGAWRIFEWHNGNETRSPDVNFSINHCRGETINIVNQQINSGRWNNMGRYPFASGKYSVKLNSNSDGIVIADAVKLRPVVYEKIIDNLDRNYSDTSGFFLSSQSPLRYDATYRACLTGLGDSAVWNLDLPFPGIWALYEWHNGNETRSSEAPFIITHDNGKSAVYINQQLNSGMWNFLGEYFFSKNTGTVLLSADCSGSYVIADAVKAIYIQPDFPLSGFIFY